MICSLQLSGQWRPEAYVIPSANVGQDWMVINFTKDYNTPIRYAPNKQQIDEFINSLQKSSGIHGVNLGKPCEVIYDEIYRGRKDLEEAINDYIQDHKALKIIIFVIPKLDELYNNIKFIR